MARLESGESGIPQVVQGRTKFCESADEMQTHFDTYLLHYNRERPHQGRNMNGRTPYQAFVEGISTTPAGEEPKAG